MDGDFTSYGHSFHFTSEIELRQHIQSFIEKSFFELQTRNYWYKKNKKFEFYIDEFTYNFTFPPILKKPTEFIRIHQIQKYQLIEHSKYYFDRNREFINQQINAIIEDFKKDSEHLNRVLFAENLFENKPLRNLTSTFNTVFDDITARELCNRISTPFIRSLLVNPNSNNIEIHKIAMRCFEKYGGHTITFILNLPPLTFSNSNSKMVTDKNHGGEIPAIKIKFLNKPFEYFICFYDSQKSTDRQRRIASVFDSLRIEPVAFLTYSGYIEQRINKENISLSLFIENFNKHPIISCSVEPGRCINCNRELTDPKSRRVGYGKDCAQELGLPYT